MILKPLRWLTGRRNGSGGAMNALCWCGIAFVSLFLVTLLLSEGGPTSESQLEMDQRLAEIKEHLDHLRFMDKEKSKALLELKRQMGILQSAASGRLPEKGAREGGGPFPAGARNNATAAILANLQKLWQGNDTSRKQAWQQAAKAGLLANLSLTGLDLAVPNLYDHLPHLLDRPSSLQPAVKLSTKNRRGLHTVIGIPTIQRPKVSYLMTTLRSIIDNLGPADREEVLVVVYIGDSGGVTEFVSEQIVLIQSEFSDAIDEGLLEIIVPPADFFPPDLDRIASTFGDPPERMRWRTKQNLDYAYLLMYCQNRARFYMQLEDDVITKPGYFERMKDFIVKQSTVPWLLLEFSSLGFIGKLFKSSDLPVVIDFLLMFHREKPVDWLLDHIFFVKFCHPEKTPKQCQAVKNKQRIRFKPSLFQHIGVHSSLKGKVQKLKERDFGKQPLHKSHADNPPAKISTSLKVYQKYSLESAYKGDTFFWGLLPQPNDWVLFEFTPAVRVESLLFRTGNAEHPDDRFANTTVEIKMADAAPPKTTGKPGELSEGFTAVTTFGKSGTAHASLNTTQPVAAVRLVVHAESDNWVILSEIWIKPLKVT